ncbi:MAG: hypothetical protein ABSG68_20565 [Thermoguttaceae bacterium]|jgi:hypothetical protein
MNCKIAWPDGKRFAFTVFDDTDEATLANVGPVYSFLADCGFRTTKSCWVLRGDPGRGLYHGETCDDPHYLNWLLELQTQGFEIGWHNGTWHGLTTTEMAAALEKFSHLFGHDPVTAANHRGAEQGVYWAERRLTGLHVALYKLLTLSRNQGQYRGHVEKDDYFWGDLCKQHVKYFRNFVFQDINTLKVCPFMPYHDPQRPYVNYWFASSNGGNAQDFVNCIAEENQDRLEEEGGACIMYAHLARGFAEGGRINPRLEHLIRRLAAKKGWFVPVATLLDHLQKLRGPHEITARERRRLERKWLWEKLLVGTN